MGKQLSNQATNDNKYVTSFNCNNEYVTSFYCKRSKKCLKKFFFSKLQVYNIFSLFVCVLNDQQLIKYELSMIFTYELGKKK